MAFWKAFVLRVTPSPTAPNSVMVTLWGRMPPEFPRNFLQCGWLPLTTAHGDGAPLNNATSTTNTSTTWNIMYFIFRQHLYIRSIMSKIWKQVSCCSSLSWCISSSMLWVLVKLCWGSNPEAKKQTLGSQAYTMKQKKKHESFLLLQQHKQKDHSQKEPNFVELGNTFSHFIKVFVAESRWSIQVGSSNTCSI